MTDPRDDPTRDDAFEEAPMTDLATFNPFEPGHAAVPFSALTHRCAPNNR